MNYIADFFCKKLCLVIEVDGITHKQEEVRRKDKKKEEDLVRSGFRVVRFADEEVLSDIEGVRRTLEFCIEEREKELRLTSTTPLREGENAP